MTVLSPQSATFRVVCLSYSSFTSLRLQIFFSQGVDFLFAGFRLISPRAKFPPQAVARGSSPRTDFPVASLPGGKSARYVFLTENPARAAEPRDTITVGGVPPTPPPRVFCWIVLMIREKELLIRKPRRVIRHAAQALQLGVLDPRP